MDCIACKKPLPDVADADNQPQGGSEFVTYGAYGSTVTDRMDGVAHVINVCDECVTDAISNGRAMLLDVNRQRV